MVQCAILLKHGGKKFNFSPEQIQRSSNPEPKFQPAAMLPLGYHIAHC
jgi:hypothetical protein